MTEQIWTGHRHGDRSFEAILFGAVTHAREHAAQLHLFLGQR